MQAVTAVTLQGPHRGQGEDRHLACGGELIKFAVPLHFDGRIHDQ